MKSRLYSISSCLNRDSNELEITFGVLKNESKFGSNHYGVCTKFLADAPIGKMIPAEIIQYTIKLEKSNFKFKFLRSNKFTLPEDLFVPVIMIGTGTGIAPFRSFWKQRENDCEKNSSNFKLGEFILFYGCREKQKDFLYMKELEQLKSKNVITQFHVAFSRESGFPKVNLNLNFNLKLICQI